jgi:hypothetical protein
MTNAVTVTATKTTPTITFGAAPTPTFGGGNFTVNATTTNTDSTALVYSVVSGPCALVSGATFSSTGAGACVVQASGAETANFNAASNTQSVTMAKATPSINVPGYSVPYDGASHGLSGTASGVGGADLSSSLTFGAAVTNVPGGTISWSFDAGANYNTASGSATVTITKASATISVSGYSGVYDASPHGASGTATGVGGVDLSAGLNLGATFTNVPGGTANWTFTDATGNYNNASGSVAIAIAKADATINVQGYTGVYDGAAHGASGSATGVLAAALAGLDLGLSFTNVPGGTANWTFTDVTGNYNNASGSVAIAIADHQDTVSVAANQGGRAWAAHGG